MTARRKLVFPAPFEPRMATTSPSPTVTEMPLCTGVAPRRVCMSSTRSIGAHVAREVDCQNRFVALDLRRRAERHEGAEVQNGDPVAGRHDQAHVVIDDADADVGDAAD